MIYDVIETEVSGYISGYFSEELSSLSAEFVPSSQILSEGEIPDVDEELFCRLVWTYGELSDFSNNFDQELPTLNIEVYERKDNGKNFSRKFIRDFRNILKNKINVKIIDNQYVKINRILISKNSDIEFYSYVISISFRLIKER